MSSKLKQEVTNWGLYPKINATEVKEDGLKYYKNFIKENEEIIPRGNGRCYGDASLSENIVSCIRLNKFIDFDRETGLMECEAGVLLSDILEVCVEAGFFLPVTPGTKYITVGGAIASDVHGKNHHVDGCFSEHVLHFDLLNEKSELIRCSREENSELFWATIGGMGLTGFIVSACFQLKKIESAYIRHEAIKAENLDEIFKLFDESESWTYTVAWIDCLQKGKNLGRSILMRGEHARVNELPVKYKQNPLKLKEKKKLTIPFFFPNFVLNSLTVKIFNFLFYNKQRVKHLKNFIDYDTFYYPLDAMLHWNRIYGKKGFIQYQFVIPKETGKEGMQEVLETIANSGEGSFLAVLKLFGKNNPEAYNSFPMEGYTLALDFKINKKLPDLVKKLDEIVEKYQGRIYRTKDSMSKPSLTNYLKNVENEKFSSLQSRRISK
ncbi:MAG: FAD-binding oxidoreductase [Flavobacteriales bacterium]|nr:FAD-binding oxidoreductase [Flavobacteriales bacterium]